MTTRIRAAVAFAAASYLLLCVAAPGFAHEAHKKRIEAEPSAVPQAEAVAPLEALAPIEAAQAETKDHDHSGHSPSSAPALADRAPELQPESNVPQPLAWLGKFHPPLTHYPIALLTAAALAELLLIRTKNVLFEHAVRFSVWLGASAALLAATLGWFFGGFHLVDDEWVMTAHRWSGSATGFLGAGLLVLCERASREAASRSFFRVALFAGAVLVGVTGFLGGALLYGLDHYTWPVSQ